MNQTSLEEMGSNEGALAVTRSSEFAGLELHSGRSFRHSYPRHWHEGFYLSAFTEGAGEFHFRGERHRVTPGTLAFIAPGEIHTHGDTGEGRSFRSMHGPQSLLSAIGWEPGAEPFAAIPSALIDAPAIVRRFHRLHRAMERGDATRLASDALLFDFFAQLLGRRVERSPGRETYAVRVARDFLDAHLQEEVSLRRLAAVAGLSPYYFHRSFVREMGIPPHAYQIQLRILSARSLLRQGVPPARVAASMGFADQAHFTRKFKQVLGVTPAEYAKQGKKIQYPPSAAG